MSNLVYRDADHSYFLDGKQVPGFTRVLSDLGAYPGSGFFTETSRVRGQQAHLACQLLDRHCPEAKTLDDALDVLNAGEDIQPYMRQYLKFRRERRYRAIAWEQPVCCPRLRTAGTPDTYGAMMSSPLAVVDAKSWQSQGAKPKHSAEIQTAFYAIGVAETLGCNPEDIERYVLKLPGGDGDYRLYACHDPRDFEEVVWACQLWWRWHDHGIFPFAGDPEQQPLAIGENA